ncbi:MAG: hypothetical protein AAFR61_15215 [Bacteroidota bacterium]
MENLFIKQVTLMVDPTYTLEEDYYFYLSLDRAVKLSFGTHGQFSGLCFIVNPCPPGDYLAEGFLHSSEEEFVEKLKKAAPRLTLTDLVATATYLKVKPTKSKKN